MALKASISHLETRYFENTLMSHFEPGVLRSPEGTAA
jgi:hypothetical protein